MASEVLPVSSQCQMHLLATMIHSFNISLCSPYSVQGKVPGPGDMVGGEVNTQG